MVRVFYVDTKALTYTDYQELKLVYVQRLRSRRESQNGSDDSRDPSCPTELDRIFVKICFFKTVQGSCFETMQQPDANFFFD